MSKIKVRPKVSIIVCHHVGDLLYDMLSSIKCSIPFEVIVITSDYEVATEGIDGCRVFYCEGLPAEKRNQGARLADGEYLAIFDDDVELLPGCIEEMVALIESNPKIGMVYGKLHKFDEPHRFDEAGGFLTSTGFIWSRAGQNIVDSGQYDKPERIFAGKSASCLVRKYAWHKVGGMDEDFGILGEESDLSWRLWLAGYEVWWCPSSVTLHKFNTPLKPVTKYYTSSRVHFNGCRNYLTMLIKNLGKEHLWIVPIHLLIWFTASVAMIGTGKITQGMNILKGLGSVVGNLLKTLEKRGMIQRRREVEERELWPIIHKKTDFKYYLQRFTRYIKIGVHG